MAYTLTGQYVYGNGAPRRGRLKFAPSVAIAGDDTVILPSPLTVDLDSGGSFSVPLVGTDDVAYSPSGWVWSCTEVIDGGRTFSFELTADSDIHTLTPVAVPDEYSYLMSDATPRDLGTAAAGTGLVASREDHVHGMPTAADVGASPVGHGHSVAVGDLTDVSTVGEAVATAADAAAARTAIGAGTSDFDGAYSSLSGKPTLGTAAAAAVGDFATVAQGATADSAVQPGDLGTAAALDVGTTAGTVAAGDDGRLSDARTPTAHAASHGAGQADEVTVDQSQVSGLDTALAAKVSGATVGNLLSANAASGTDALGDTTGTDAANMTLSSSTDWAMTGTRSLKAVANLSVVSCYPRFGGTYSTGEIVVTPGREYTFRVSLWSDVATPPLYAVVRCFEEDGTTYVGNALGVPVSPTTTPATASVTFTVPAGAYRASAYIFPTTAWTAGNYVHMDNIGFWAGAGGDWAMPGTPITNMGRRVTHPNTDDVLAQQWDSTTGGWQTVRADSGRRALTLANSWTATTKALRRCDEAVELVLVGLNGASASSGIVVTLDAAFRPPYAVTFGIGTTAPGLPAHVVTVNADGTVVVGGTYANVTAGSAILRFMTAAAWPSTLPGTLISAAPA